MANELTITYAASYSAGGVELDFPKETFNITINGDYVRTAAVGMSASETLVDVGDMTTPGYMLVENISAADESMYFQAGTSETAFGSIGQGEFALFRIHPDATLYVYGDSSNTRMRYWIFED